MGILAHLAIITKAVRFDLNQNGWLFLFCMWWHCLSICGGQQENGCGILGRSRPMPDSGQTLSKAITLREFGGPREDTAWSFRLENNVTRVCGCYWLHLVSSSKRDELKPDLADLQAEMKIQNRSVGPGQSVEANCFFVGFFCVCF